MLGVRRRGLDRQRAPAQLVQQVAEAGIGAVRVAGAFVLQAPGAEAADAKALLGVRQQAAFGKFDQGHGFPRVRLLSRGGVEGGRMR